MSQENVERLRAVYGDWERGDFTASLPLFDENVTLAIDSGIPDGGIYMRPDGVLKYMSRFLAPWESLTIAGESFRDTGDTVLVKVRQNGIGRSSGAPVELRYFQL
jgi:ketosteroid isomerase-like protein